MNKYLKEVCKYLMKNIQKISPDLATQLLFKKYMGVWIDMKNPKTLNEKMQWLKLKKYKDDNLVKQCVDKYSVRKYVENKGRGDLLVELLGVWDSPEQIDFDNLPDKFVLKCNHGSGSVIICRDKKNFDFEKSKSLLKHWLNEDFGEQRAELSYKGVKKKIICEKLIETEDNLAPKDYKFFCNYGEPKFLFVASGRNGDEAYFDFYDLNWNHYDVENDHPNSPIGNDKPECFNEMIRAAKDLSKDFPIVRVDLYFEQGKIYFGELTFLHFGGLHPFTPSKFDKFFGDMMDIDCELEKK